MSKKGYFKDGDFTAPLVTPIYDLSNKERLVSDYIKYFAIRTQSMFEYDNLPPKIPQWVAEKLDQINGHLTLVPHKDYLYALGGTLGGAYDENLMPTISVIANAALNISKAYKIHEECVVIPNDTYYVGLLPLFSKYATMLAENDITLTMADINGRIVSLITAGTDKALKAAVKYLDDIKAGKLGVIADSSFIEGIKTQVYNGASSGQAIKAYTEYEQYRLASLWNELGLRDNYNMKREAINGTEAALNDDVLLPLADNMLKCRQDGWNEAYELFGEKYFPYGPVVVRLSSAWEDRQLDRNMTMLQIEAETLNENNALEEEIKKETLADIAEDAGISEDVIEEKIDEQNETVADVEDVEEVEDDERKETE